MPEKKPDVESELLLSFADWMELGIQIDTSRSMVKHYDGKMKHDEKARDAAWRRYREALTAKGKLV